MGYASGIESILLKAVGDVRASGAILPTAEKAAKVSASYVSDFEKYEWWVFKNIFTRSKESSM